MSQLGCGCRPDAVIGIPFEFEPPVRFYHGSRGFVKISAFSYCNSPIDHCEIGRYCSISHNVENVRMHPINWLCTTNFTYDSNIFETANHQVYPPLVDAFEEVKKITIGNDVWIGTNVRIKTGIKIGTGAIIGTNSYVTKDVEPYAIVGGVPAKLIRYRFDEKTRKILLDSQWWKYNILGFKQLGINIDIKHPLKVIEQIKEAELKGIIKPYESKFVRITDENLLM